MIHILLHDDQTVRAVLTGPQCNLQAKLAFWRHLKLGPISSEKVANMKWHEASEQLPLDEFLRYLGDDFKSITYLPTVAELS